MSPRMTQNQRLISFGVSLFMLAAIGCGGPSGESRPAGSPVPAPVAPRGPEPGEVIPPVSVIDDPAAKLPKEFVRTDEGNKVTPSESSSTETSTSPAAPTPGNNFMATLFIILSHLVTLAGLAALGYGGFRAIIATRSISERIVRGLAMTAGTFAYLASKALGISLPTIILESVEAGKWFSFITIGAIIPSLAGFFLSRYIMSCMRKHDAIAIRVMIMMAALIFVMFGDVYVAAAGQAKLLDLRPLLPNVSFLLTMMCYVVFEYRPRDIASLDVECSEFDAK